MLRSEKMYSDDSWHRVIFSKQGPNAKLVINDEVVSDSGGHSVNNPVIRPPYYLGGIDHLKTEMVFTNLVSFN